MAVSKPNCYGKFNTTDVEINTVCMASKEYLINHLDKVVQPSYTLPTQITPLLLPQLTSMLVNLTTDTIALQITRAIGLLTLARAHTLKIELASTFCHHK